MSSGFVPLALDPGLRSPGRDDGLRGRRRAASRRGVVASSGGDAGTADRGFVSVSEGLMHFYHTK